MGRQTELMERQGEIIEKQDEILDRRHDLRLVMTRLPTDEKVRVVRVECENIDRRSARDLYWTIWVPHETTLD